jgi:sphingolipid delta-4 desaturase
MGHEPLTKYVAMTVVLLQLFTAILLRHTSPLSFTFFFLAYVVGGTANQHVFLAIHEITHNVRRRHFIRSIVA